MAEGTLITTYNQTAANADARGITWLNGKLYVTDLTDDEVYVYNDDGTFDTNWDISGFVPTCSDITNDGTFLYIVNALGAGSTIEKYNTSGTRQSGWDTHANNNDPYGICSDGVSIWVSDGTTTLMYRYDLQGNFLETFPMNAASDNPTGMYTDGTTIFQTDTGDDVVYKYNMEGAQFGNFDIVTGGNADSRGFGGNGTNRFYATDWVDNKIYVYEYVPPVLTPPLSSAFMQPVAQKEKKKKKPINIIAKRFKMLTKNQLRGF